MKEWFKQFLLGAFLILVAGVVFYIVAPKWHYMIDGSGGLSYKYNSITGTISYLVGRRQTADGIFIDNEMKVAIGEPRKSLKPQ